MSPALKELLATLPAANKPESPSPAVSTIPKDLDSISFASPARVEFLIEAPVTEQKLLLAVFATQNQDVYPVATDQFLSKSKDSYTEHWLVRELVQNFVDHNRDHPGTLNGVTIKDEIISDGSHRFSIIGNWQFESPTGLLSPHSDKPADRETAGGNGIGLKQTAIRLLRDFGTSKFEIQGAAWNCDFEVARKDQVNHLIAEISQNSSQYKIQNDWLLGKLSAVPERAKTSYIIETKDPDLIAALKTLPDLGVSDSNRFLQNLDFKNSCGSFAWLLPEDSNAPIPRGRFFLNGQVMSFESHSRSGHTQDTWNGPEGISIQLSNVPYKMSIDRPPTSALDFQKYIKPLIKAMHKEGKILEQLQKSEPLWSHFDKYGYPPFAHAHHTMIDAMVQELKKNGYNAKNYAADFPDRKYAYSDKILSDEQQRELKDKGITLVPGYFKGLGMPDASSYFSVTSHLSTTLPSMVDFNLTKLAETKGIAVSANPFPSLRDASHIGKEFHSLFGKFITSSTIDENGNLSLSLNLDLPKKLLSHPIPNPNSNEQHAIYNLRGLVLKLLSTGTATSVTSQHADYFTTYSLGFDSAIEQSVLEVLNNPHVSNKSETSIFISLHSSRASSFIKALLPEENTTLSAESDKGVSSEKKLPDNIEGVLNEIEQSGAVKTIKDLADAVEQANEKESRKGPVEKIDEWRGSQSFYGQLMRGAKYVTTQSLSDIMNSNHEAVIPPDSTISGQGQKVPQTLSEISQAIQRMKVALSNNPGIDFQIVGNPTASQLGRLQELLTYTEVAIGYRIQNDLFLYSGKGTKGLNVAQRAIGLHEGTLDAPFHEALNVFLHEIAHNRTMNHDTEFIHMDEALQTRVRTKLALIADKLYNHKALSDEETFLVEILPRWDTVRELRD